MDGAALEERTTESAKKTKDYVRKRAEINLNQIII